MVSRQGLSEIHAPPSDEAATALIIFVHGLFGHPYETWTWKTSSRTKSPSRFEKPHRPEAQVQVTHKSNNDSSARIESDSSIYWPQDLLRKVVSDVRIFTWGYDADIASFSSASRNTIHQHAGNLLSDLVDLRAESEQYRKPIIFVVHSLGGIIVKTALNISRSTEGTSLKDIAPATSGICFLGTPHRGSPTASIGKIAFRITKTAGMKPNTKILQGLERNSETLDIISDDFSQTVEKYGRNLQVHSFREEKLTKKWGLFPTMVVDPDSAKIGLGHERNGSIPADHSNMTKFGSIEDVGFKRISAQLRRWVGQKRLIDAPGLYETSSFRHKNCMDSLTKAATKERFLEVEKAHMKTFEWLFDPNLVSFSTWLSEDVATSGPVYWVQGKPGSGKSTLMKYAMNDNRTWELLKGPEGADWSRAAFFFHDRGYTIQKSLMGMLQELISSIWRQLPQLWFCVEPEYTKLVRAQAETRNPTWNLSSLKSILFSFVEQRKVPLRVILFLDALDEHAGDNDELAQILKSMADKVDNQCVVLRLCLASRSWNVFEHHFGRYPGLAIHEHTQTDIDVYTRSHLEASIDDPELITPERLGTLTQQITLKACGVFIWVRLVVEQLAKGIRDGSPYSSLEDEVARMPQKLEDLYVNILERLDPQYVDEAYIMLHVAMSTLEPLPLENFLSAVSFVRKNKRMYLDTKWEIQDEQHQENSEKAYLRRLASRSGGLLETYVSTTDGSAALSAYGSPQSQVNHGKQPKPATRIVQFLHATAKEYIQKCQDRLLEGRIEQLFTNVNGDDFLFLCSVSCRAWVAPIKKHMLYYAKLVELRTINDASVANRNLVLLETISELSESRSPCDLVWWMHQSQEGLFKDISKEVKDMDVPWTHRMLPLAVAGNLKSLVQNLLRGQNLETKLETWLEDFCLLKVAATGPCLVPIEHHDRIGMIEILLSSKYPIDHLSSPRDIYCHNDILGAYLMTPLCFVMARKIDSDYSEEIQLDIARYLLTRGANPECFVFMGRYANDTTSLLAYCVLYCSAATVCLLLQHGAHVNTRSSRYQLTPYQFAILRQDKDIMQAMKEANDTAEPENMSDTESEYRPEAVMARTGLWIASGTMQSGLRALELVRDHGHSGTIKIYRRRASFLAEMSPVTSIEKEE